MKRVGLLILASVFCVCGYAQSVVSVAAAANVRDAMEEIKGVYLSENNGITINVNYGGSGMLVQQIVNGAGYDLFFSADEGYALKLKEGGYTLGEVSPYVCGKLLLYSRSIDISQIGVGAFTLNKSHKIAIANPNAAPYGVKAIEALNSLGIYDEVKSKIIYGENIGAAAQYVFSGNTDMGVIALSQYKSPTAQSGGYVAEVPDSLYSPIIQSCVAIKQKAENVEAIKFMEYVLSEKSRDIWIKYGYSVME
ncbi:MAG: molybdate ABC transporter substrate-binding protein [Rikenellaceae bacterium]